MMGARGLQILEDYSSQCRETLVNSFGLADNVKHSATATIISRRLRAEASRRSLTIDAPGLPPHRRPTVHRLIGRITQVVDALGDEECLDWEVLKRLNTDDINAIPGLVAADQRQALVRAANTMTMITTWSPAVHRYFPRDEREAIVATLLELKKAGLPNDVIVGHVLPSTFAPPWAESEEERHDSRRWQRIRALLQG